MMLILFNISMSNSSSYSTYQSVFSWRYGSDEMRYVFSEENRYLIWRKIWVAMATVQSQVDLVSSMELADLKKHEKKIDIDRAREIEKETRHDVVAAIREYAEKAKVGGGKINLGATSMDVVDNADTLKMKQALELVESRLVEMIGVMSDLVERYADVVTMGYTHLQSAEPTTVGYRLAFYLQDLSKDVDLMRYVYTQLKSKGFKGAVGTAASYQALLQDTAMNVAEFEREVLELLNLEADVVATQVNTRKTDYLVMTVLASISSSLHKFAADVRILQSANFSEWSEPFAKGQVGSSAMPFKKNPIKSENICSLARYVATLPMVVLDNASHSYLERTLDDSANRRAVIPDGFLAVDQMLLTALSVAKGLVVFDGGVKRNVDKFAPFAASERILMECVKQGANRQKMHEKLREIALEAWDGVMKGGANKMEEMLVKDPEIGSYLSGREIHAYMDVSHHVGDCAQRAREMVAVVRKQIGS